MSAELMVPTTSTPEVTPEQPPLKACTECSGVVRIGRGFVPPLGVLYPKLGHGKPDRMFPLTNSELLSQELCGSPQDKKKYGKLYTTAGTLNLMERWKTAKAKLREEYRLLHKQEKEKRRREQHEKRELERASRGPIPADTKTKVYGEMRPVAKQSSKKKNKKGGDGDQNKGGKGKGR